MIYGINAIQLSAWGYVGYLGSWGTANSVSEGLRILE